jgi:capsular exopolysaccharide synthesis family protein
MEMLYLKDEEVPYSTAEELKLLRTNIQFCGSEKKVIMFTSCESGEGKSTITLELASSFGSLGKTVLFIDTDLRKSQLKNRIEKGKVEFGLSNYLSGQCGVNDMIYATQASGLFVVPAGQVLPNPAELLSNKRFRTLIKGAREVYDYIIIDCAPLGMVVDAAVIAPECDGSVLLIESGTIHQKFAKDTLTNLKKTGCPVLGVVLNKVDLHKMKYYSNGKYGKTYTKEYSHYN